MRYKLTLIGWAVSTPLWCWHWLRFHDGWVSLLWLVLCVNGMIYNASQLRHKSK